MNNTVTYRGLRNPRNYQQVILNDESVAESQRIAEKLAIRWDEPVIVNRYSDTYNQYVVYPPYHESQRWNYAGRRGVSY